MLASGASAARLNKIICITQTTPFFVITCCHLYKFLPGDWNLPRSFCNVLSNFEGFFSVVKAFERLFETFLIFVTLVKLKHWHY
jgi:hypothetical protein